MYDVVIHEWLDRFSYLPVLDKRFKGQAIARWVSALVIVVGPTALEVVVQL